MPRKTAEGKEGEQKKRGPRRGAPSIYTQEYRVFLDLLVAARVKSGLSQRALADKLDRSYSYVGKIETGQARVDIYQIRQYLLAVETPFLEFMQEYESALQSTPQHHRK